MLDFAVRDIHPLDTLVVCPLIQQTPYIGLVSPFSRRMMVLSTQMSPGTETAVPQRPCTRCP